MTISQYIAQDLESRIVSGDSLPAKLTLGALAECYEVSVTPVRLALSYLIDRNLIVRQSNGRLRVSPPRNKRIAAAIPDKPRDWDAILAEEVLLLGIRGESNFIREEAMAERHGIGRTLLRRVFNRLAGGGLLTHVPRRGWRVRKFVEKDMDAFIAVRETLETMALDLARPNLNLVEIDRMLDGNSVQNVRRGQIDNDLHAYFIQKSGNRYVESFFQSNSGYYMALFDYATLGTKVIAAMAGQHRDILENVKHKHWAKARTALSSHIRAQKPIMMKMVKILRDSNMNTLADETT
ncbi:MAG: GntR family transcriptional regulator [Planctomycetota bacterium]